jgi:O-succinylbenzoate synthase
MKIERANLYHLRMPLRSAFETSFGRIQERDCILVEVFCQGVLGYGECAADRNPGYSYETALTAWHVLRDCLFPSILGTEIAEPSDVQQLMSWVRGHRMAKAALEMALWDVWGKQRDQALVELLGGARQKVVVGVSVGIQESIPSLLRVVEDYLQQGYQRIKIKIKPGRDVAETQALRNAYPGLNLQVDANSAYTLDTASTLAPLDDLNLLLIEQPLADDDLWDHSKLQHRFKTPLCLDESILEARHARQALEMKAAGVINIKVGRVGGLNEAKAIHDLCLSKEIPVWCGGMLETGIGRAANLALASLPGFTLPGDISATERYYARDITYERFALNPDSTIDVPRAKGLGVTIDPQALNLFTVNTLQV